MAKLDGWYIRWVTPCTGPLPSDKVLGADLGLRLWPPGLAIFRQSLDCCDPQLSLLWIAGGETEETNPFFFALFLGTVVRAAHNRARVRHGELKLAGAGVVGRVPLRIGAFSARFTATL